MKNLFATASLLSAVLFLTACSSTGSYHQSAPKATSDWQKCSAVGGAVLGIPAAIGSLSTGGVAAVIGAMAGGIGCAVAGQNTPVLFDFGAYDLDMKDRLTIDKMIGDMKPDSRIKVIGYTCDIGTEEENQTLSENRADEVKKYLMSRGIEESKIITEGMGEKNPVANNDSEENRQLNRRAELIISH